MHHQCAACNAVLDMGCIIPEDFTWGDPAKFCVSIEPQTLFSFFELSRPKLDEV